MLGLTTRSRLRRLLLIKQRHEEIIARLEIQVRRQQLTIDELAADLERVSGRMCQVEGRVLGGSKGRARKAANGAGTQMDLDEIPHGDKAALREYFLRNPPKKDQEH